MSTEIKAFEPSSLKDVVSERIRASFVELIPEDAWKQMVQSAISEFTAPQKGQYGYGAKPSMLHGVIHRELEARFQPMVTKTLEDEGYLSWHSDNSGFIPTDKVAEIIKALVPDIVNAMFSSWAQFAVNKIGDSLKQGSRY